MKGIALYSLRLDTQPIPFVLLVDDHADSLAVLEDLFEFMEMRAVGARGATVALDLLEGDELPAVIVTDLSMPHVDGWMLIERLRQNHRTQAIPVVVLTAHADDTTRLRVEAVGASYLTKPFHPTELVETVRRLTHSQQRFDRRKGSTGGGQQQRKGD